ncbi:dihydrofolate reductase family protein [Pseudonocardia charpentierae]|uniref:Dihydrofolate reductase family protein n=1 Tax=Pseudonocardia charpentierae TaxID=3075545 RepID=A0ABU2N529_9PSEU|nr:dihydrofolate reductase family protein [Pseudonocardia sp. DSM 45834]MDT0349022.1 dihydrofolate reductase family protein [Pseudonocardia sp. DSM 45834]
MRTLAITQNVTADGAVEMLGDWFDPTAEDRQVTEAMNRFTERGDALLLGRRTFEDFRGFWPKQTDDHTGVTDELNRVQKYVVSSTMTDPQWQNSTILSGDWLARVAELKEQPGGDIGVTGSIRVCHALIEAGLVDEYRLFVYPVVQGRGRRLFPEGFEADRLRVVDVAGFDSGVTLLHYATR